MRPVPKQPERAEEQHAQRERVEQRRTERGETADGARAGNAKAFGRPVNITYDFKKADVVLSLDADFLCAGPGSVRYSRDFRASRPGDAQILLSSRGQLVYSPADR